MCQSGREMYEGKNIHYSPVDNKPLCSFSNKQCNQRRLSGYGFCVRHILEDPTAPFRRCAYVAKSSQQMCTQAIPLGESRQYCNNHMQVLGMLPRRERKPKKDKELEKEKVASKEKDANSSLDGNKMTFQDRLKSKKLVLTKGKPSALLGTVVESQEDPDDPYAFHDAAPDVVQSGVNCTQVNPSVSVSTSVCDAPVRSPHPQANPSPLPNRPPSDCNSGLPKAKLYPELAEKLEKVRPNVESKIPKSRARSSRTMNKLQTKIAQNKIKDKLRKSQESNQSEMSPSQVSSPERVGLASVGVGVACLGMPGSDLNTSSICVGVNSTHLDCLSGMEPLSQECDDTDFRHVEMGYRTDSEAAGHLGVDQLTCDPVPSQLVSSRSGLPPPYPGLPANKDVSFPSPAEVGSSQRLLAGAVSSVSLPASPCVPAQPSWPSAQTPSAASASSLTQPQHHQQQMHHSHQVHQHQQLQQQQMQQQPNHLLPQLLQRNPSHQQAWHQQLQSPQQQQQKVTAPFSVEISELGKYPHLPSVVDQTALNRQSENNSAYPQTSAILTSKVSLASPVSQLPPTSSGGVASPTSELPPPPPYVPRPSACSLPASAASSSVLFTRPQRLKGLLSEKEARMRLKNDLAVKVYAIYARRRIRNHVFVGSSMSLCASDEENSCEEDEYSDMLPWQSDWCVISDDEEDNELDADGELPSDLRTAKLGLLRARLRRQCTQIKHATRSNTSVTRANIKFTQSLLRLAKDNSVCAAQTLGQILQKPVHGPTAKPNKQKSVWKKVCLYKDAEDKQCSNMCLPYANHCRKHIMYNVDQQLFQFCTAKLPDNTQCCMPVIDLRRDVPLCFPHGATVDKMQREEVPEVKKRPRKKTKPPALTRPPRKGKKKKSKYVRPQKPLPPDRPTGDTSMPDTVLMDVDVSRVHPAGDGPGTDRLPVAPGVGLALAPSSASEESVVDVVGVGRDIKNSKHLDQALVSVDLDETLSPDFDKPFELPLEQASRLLEEQDFQDVFNKIPDDAFTDIFSMADKNGDHVTQDVEELERALAEATKDVQEARENLDKLLKGTMHVDDLNEEAKQHVVEVLASNLQGFSVDAVHQADVATSAAANLDIFNGMIRSPGISSLSLSIQHSPVAPQHVQQHQQQLVQSTSAGSLADYTQMVSVAGTSRGLQQQPPSMAAYLPTIVTTINGLNLPLAPGIAASSSAGYPSQTVLNSIQTGYPSSTTMAQATSAVVTHSYTDRRQPPVYHAVGNSAGQAQGAVLAGQSSPVSQGLPSLAGFATSLQGLPSALLISDLAHSPHALLTHSLPSLQHQQLRTAGGVPSPVALTPPPQLLGGTLQLDVGTSNSSSNNSNNLHQVVVTTSQLQSPPQPVLAAHLAGHWVPASSLQQQQQQVPGASYHINGFPTSAPHAYVHPAISGSPGVPSSTTPLPKFSTLTAQTGNSIVTGSQQSGHHGLAATTVPKHGQQLVVGTVSHQASGLATGITMVTGPKQDPRLAALSHSIGIMRSGSPGGLAGYSSPHSPSSTPQIVSQTVTPLPLAVPAQQGNGGSS